MTSPIFWDADVERMRTLASMFSEQGYTCLEVDLAHPEKATTSDALMHHFESGESSSTSPCDYLLALCFLCGGAGRIESLTS